MPSGSINKPTVDAEFDSGRFCYSQLTYPVEYKMSPHRHALAQLVLCLDGGVEHHTSRCRHYQAENTGGYVRADEVHSDLFLSKVRVFQISIATIQDGVFPEACDTSSFHRFHPMTTLLKSVYQEFSQPDRYTPIMLESLTMEALVSLHRDQNQIPPCQSCSRWLERARELIHEELSESLTLDRIAAEVGVHPAHLAKAFRRQYGGNVGEYIRRLRLARATHLLESTEMTIASIAWETGFGDQSHFTKSFKKSTGQTPNAYRGIKRGSETTKKD